MISKPIILNNFKRAIALNTDYLLSEAIELVSMTDAGVSNKNRVETTRKFTDIEAVLTDPDSWTDDISFKDKIGNVYFIDDLIDKEVKIGNKKITILEESSEFTLNEEGHDYTVEWKVGDEIDLPVVGKCRVEEINVQPKKIYKNPWVCSSTDFFTFEPQKLFLKTTHKPQSIGKNAMVLKTLDSFGDSILMYQYRANNNKVYTQYAYMT